MTCEVCGAARAWRCVRRLTCERVDLCLACLRVERAIIRARIELWIEEQRAVIQRDALQLYRAASSATRAAT